MADVIQFEREPWQRQVCKMTGMACMAKVECACICKHEKEYRQASVAMYGIAERDLERRFGLPHGACRLGGDADLIQFAKTGAPPEIS